MEREFDVLDIIEEMEKCIEPFERAKTALSCEAHDYDDGNGAEKDEQEDILNDMIYSMEEIIEEVKNSLTINNEEELTYCMEKVREFYNDVSEKSIDANIADERNAEYWLDKSIEKLYEFEELVNKFFETDFNEILELQSRLKEEESKNNTKKQR